MPSLKAGIASFSALALALLACVDDARGAPPTTNPQLLKLNSKAVRPAKLATQSAAVTFPQYNFTQPLDHFTTTGFTWQQRYWVSDRHYKPGGPVIVFEAGEGPGDERMAILDTGIVNILANATNGLGIVLEHRYYGKSVPVLNFTTDSLRWLNNEQAAADSANFISSVKIPGISTSVTAPKTPWIYYGGSYGGARAAHMRVLYPDIVFGAIASSGVTHATVVDWRYPDLIRQYASQTCVARIETAIAEVDSFLASNKTSAAIKAVFGLGGISYDPDFASLLSIPIGGWQGTNWDPAVNDPSWSEFCAALGPVDSATVKTQGLTISNATASFAKYINAVRFQLSNVRLGVPSRPAGPVLRDDHRQGALPADGPLPDLAPLAVPGLHPVGLLYDSPARRVHAAPRLQPPDQGVRRADLHALLPPGPALLHPPVAQRHGRQQAWGVQHRGRPPRDHRRPGRPLEGRHAPQPGCAQPHRHDLASVQAHPHWSAPLGRERLGGPKQGARVHPDDPPAGDRVRQGVAPGLQGTVLLSEARLDLSFDFRTANVIKIATPIL